jgi:hypothetical protein
VTKLTPTLRIVAITSWGLPADTISKVLNVDIPGNLWYEIAERQERSVKVQPAVLYSTQHLKATVSTYYADHLAYGFDAKVVAVFPNVTR